MSIVEPTLHSLARATAVAAVTFVLLATAGPGVRAASRGWQAVAFWLAAAAALCPGFAVGFLIRKPATGGPWPGAETLYTLLVCSRHLPLILVLASLFPPRVSDEASHCMRLAALPRHRRLLAEIRSWSSGMWFAVALSFLLAFQEFEIATTWNMRAWTVALFDAQIGGLALAKTLALAAAPLAVPGVLGVALAPLLRRIEPPGFSESRSPRARAGLVPLALASAVICAPVLLAPAIALRQFAVKGTALLALAPLREIANAILLGAAATTAAWVLAGWIERRRGWRWLCALPGLLGPMLCALILLTLLQTPPLHLLRDTAFPAVLGLALVLLPYALLLRFGIDATRDRTALHTARASGGRRAIWDLDRRPRLCALLTLFCFAYGDFTINSLLAPPQFTSVSTRLLNLLHYGRSESLMAMFALAFAVPAGLALLTVLAARFYPRRRAS